MATQEDYSRFTDNPFRSPDVTPEQEEWLNKRNEALRIYWATGDKKPAQEIGLFPSDGGEQVQEIKKSVKNIKKVMG